MEQVYAIVSELGAELGDPLGPAQPLGGKGGRDYRVRLVSGEYVVRLPRRDHSPMGVSRDSERLANEMAASLGIAPEVAGAGPGWLVTRFLDRRPIDSARLRKDPAPVVAALRSFHRSGLQLADRFRVPELLDAHAAAARDRGATLPDAYGAAHALTVKIAEALQPSEPVACHNNLLPGNVLELAPAGSTAPARIALVDWEDAAMGDPLFDLATLAVHSDFDEPALQRLLAAYDGDPPSGRRVSALQLMCLMVLARGAVVRWAQGGPVEHFEALLSAADDPRVKEWLSSAAA